MPARRAPAHPRPRAERGQRGNHRRRRLAPVGRPRRAIGPGQQRTEEALPRGAQQYRDPGGHQFRQAMQQRPIVLSCLGESQPGVDHQLGRVDARGHRVVHAGEQVGAHFGHHIAVVRYQVRAVRRHRAPVHQHPWHTGFGHQRCHRRVGPSTGHVVDDLRAVLQRRARHSRVHGVDADGNSLCSKLFDDGHDAGRLRLGVDPSRTGPGRLTPDVDDARAFGSQRQTMLDGAVGVEVAPAVGERVVSDVENPHHLHGCRTHLRRMRSSASAREAASVLN